MKYGNMAVDQDNYLKNSNNGIFKRDMVFCVLIVIFIIILERYVNRSDTKETVQKSAAGEDATFFDSKKDFFARSST